MEWRKGDFSGLVDSSGRKYTLYDPWTTQPDTANWARTPYPEQPDPHEAAEPAGQVPLQRDAGAQHAGHQPAGGRATTGTGAQQPPGVDAHRNVDHRLSDRDQMFVRYTKGVRDSFAQSGTTTRPLRWTNRPTATGAPSATTPAWFPGPTPSRPRSSAKPRQRRLRRPELLQHRRRQEVGRHARAAQSVQRIRLPQYHQHRRGHGVHHLRQPARHHQPDLQLRREPDQDPRPARIPVRRAHALRGAANPAGPAAGAGRPRLLQPGYGSVRSRPRARPSPRFRSPATPRRTCSSAR